MKKLITAILVFFGFLAGNVIAGGVCATGQCENARKIPDLPADVESFVDRRDGCDHFRGEPWPEGNDPDAVERREFIFQSLEELCTGTDKHLKELRDKYRNNQLIAELLDGYEDQVEASE